MNERLYTKEMGALTDQAILRLRATQPRITVFTFAIWTDAAGRISATSIDTKENSDDWLSKKREYYAGQQLYWVEEGDDKMAHLFDPARLPPRNDNPADFRYPAWTTVQHKSFDKAWCESRACWGVLGRLLAGVQRQVCVLLRGEREIAIHPDAIVVVNGKDTWYANPLSIQSI